MDATIALRTVVEVLVEKGVCRRLLSAGVSAAVRAVCLPPGRVQPEVSASSVPVPAGAGDGRRLRRALAQRRRRLRKQAAKRLSSEESAVKITDNKSVLKGSDESEEKDGDVASAALRPASTTSAAPMGTGSVFEISAMPIPTASEMEVDSVEKAVPVSSSSMSSAKGLGSGRSGRRGRLQPSELRPASEWALLTPEEQEEQMQLSDQRMIALGARISR